jgi:hypothetical protein
MNYESLRRRNKKILLDCAFKLFPPKSGDVEKQKKYWLECLINGHSVQDVISQLKSGQLKCQAKQIPVTLTTSTLGSVCIEDNDLEFHAGLKRKLRIKVSNHSKDLFQTTLKEPLNAAYHWYDASGKIYEYDGIRTPLPQPIRPGSEYSFEIDVATPKTPGHYSLMATLIVEGQAWLEEKGLDVYKHDIEVTELKEPGMTKRAQQIYNKLRNRLTEHTTDSKNIKEFNACAS